MRKLQSISVETMVKKICNSIKKGKVIACPTDTVYGLLADATNAKAVRRIFLIKGREKKKPLPIFVGSIAMAKKLAQISRTQEHLLKKSWPGKTTFVLKSRGVLPKETGTQKTIGLRIPKHRFILAVLSQLKTPLTATSANVSGMPSCRNKKEVMSQFQKRKHQPDIVVDGGRASSSKPSRVIDLTQKKPKILRR